VAETELENRILKIAGLSVVAFTVTAAVLWMIFVRAPSPEEVCAHRVELSYQAGAKATAAAETLVDRLTTRCIEDEERRIRLRGRLVYAKYSKCVLSATDLGEAERC
jgi:hypothetical protein